MSPFDEWYTILGVTGIAVAQGYTLWKLRRMLILLEALFRWSTQIGPLIVQTRVMVRQLGIDREAPDTEETLT